MTLHSVTPVNEEMKFDDDEIIVSKTDLKGRLTYGNDVFCRLAEMSTREIVGQPHSIIRHPDMPRAIFKLLWDTIQSGVEIFAYVKNMSKTGKYYWVFAHVTPSTDKNGNVIGYHSNRRSPSRNEIDNISRIYQSIRQEEKRHANAKDGMDAGYRLLQNLLEEQKKTYSEFIWSLRN